MKMPRLFYSILIAGLIAGCSKPAENAPAPEEPQTPVKTIRTQRASVETVTDNLEAPARVIADPGQVVHVFPPVSGRLLSVNVQLGDTVKEGQPLAVVVSSDAASARSDHEKAVIEAERSERAYQRAKTLYEHEAIAEKDLIDAKAAAAGAKSEAARALQRLHVLGLDENNLTDRVTIHAPRSGVVIEVSSAQGELSRSLDNANSIVTIAALDTVWIMADVLESDLERIHVGEKVAIAVQAYSGEILPGTVSAILDVLDPTTRTVKVRVVMPNPKHTLKPEMFANMMFIGTPHTVMMLPHSAVLREGEKTFVFVGKNGKYTRKDISLGHVTSERCEITRGIEPTDDVVVNGAAFLRGQESGGK